MNDVLYTTEEAAPLLGMTPGSVQSYCKTGRLHGIQRGRFWLIPAEEIDRYNRERQPHGGGARLRPVPKCTDDDTIEIPLSTGTVALINGVDRDLYAHQWQISNGYVRRHERPKTIVMHRVIVERMIGRALQRGEYVDHINRVKTDNRRINLRIANASQNGANRKPNQSTYTGLKGVSYHKKQKRWIAQIANKFLGSLDTQKEAVHAYNEAATELYGEYAHLNSIAE